MTFAPIRATSWSLITALFIALVWPANTVQATNDFNLPDLGEPAAATLSELKEQQLGRRFMARLRRSQPIISDPLIEDYISTLGGYLASHSARPNARYTFFVIEQKTLNAFAAPGGYIGVNSGLILAAENESELGGVLAHEISHATQKHLARLIARSKELSLPAAAALVGAILLGGQAGTAALVATNAAVLSDRLAYTRDFEREADALGIRMLQKSGLNPRGMVDFFDRMQRWARVQELSVPEFLRTHPLTTSRIAEAQARLRQLGPSESRVSAEYQLIRTRVRALYAGHSREALAHFDAKLEQHREQAGASASPANDLTLVTLLYGRALALDRLGQHDESERVLVSLLADSSNHDALPAKADTPSTTFGRVEPVSEIVTRALIDNYRHSRKFDLALQTLQELRANSVGSDELLNDTTRAKIHFEKGDIDVAHAQTRKLSRSYSTNAAVQKLHAEVSAGAGSQAESHEAMAMHHFLQDNFVSAIDQLFAARNLSTDDYYATARIEARIEEVQHAKRLLESGK